MLVDDYHLYVLGVDGYGYYTLHTSKLDRLLKIKMVRGCMEENKVKAWYDKTEDILYLLFKEGPNHEVIEADPDVHLELDENGKIMGIEIWNARKNGLIKQIQKATTETPA